MIDNLVLLRRRKEPEPLHMTCIEISKGNKYDESLFIDDIYKIKKMKFVLLITTNEMRLKFKVNQ